MMLRLVAGCVAIALVAAAMAVGLPFRDALVLVGVAAAAGLAAAAIGAALLHALRSHPFSTQVVVVAFTAVLAVAVGAVTAAGAMLLVSTDVRPLLLVIATAGSVGMLVAVDLTHRVDAQSRLLEGYARDLAEGVVPEEDVVGIREFDALAAELRETAERLEQARARERAMDQARRELVSWVSHDLRTPLSGIRAISEALEDGVVTDAQTVSRYYATLRTETDRLAVLVDDLFVLSRISAGVLVLELEEADLSQLVSDALAAAAPVAEAKGVRLEGSTLGSLPAVPVATPELLRVLGNLLDNAIRETPAQGEVQVQAGVSHGLAFVDVRDTCGGIPVSELERVFETGFRGTAARTPRSDGGGGGLGLTIARGLVEAQGGSLTVSNREGGCAFRVQFPLS
jgi:signal transduction histidine kinase